MSAASPATLEPSAVTTNDRARRQRKRRITRWLKRGLMAAAAAAALALLVRAWLPKPVRVDAGTVGRGSLEVVVEEDGKTRVRERFVVSAPLSGNLERVELEPGAEVAQGAVLARIFAPDPAMLDSRSRSEAEARLAGALAHQRQAEVAVARATTARDAAVREATRMRNLAEQHAIPARDREQAELAEQLAVTEVAAAGLQRVAATTEVRAARAVLGRGDGGAGAGVTVPAPTAGRVLRVLRDSAGPIAVGAPLLELGQPTSLEVVVDVLSSDAAQIPAGAAATIDRWGGAQLSGHVRLVEPSAFTRMSALGIEEQRVNVVIALDAAPPVLGDGFRVEARIELWRGDDVITVPSGALFRDHDRWAVYAIEDGRARLRPLELGHRGPTDVEVLAGISPGTAIVLHPGDRVADGVKLVIIR